MYGKYAWKLFYYGSKVKQIDYKNILPISKELGCKNLSEILYQLFQVYSVIAT